MPAFDVDHLSQIIGRLIHRTIAKKVVWETDDTYKDSLHPSKLFTNLDFWRIEIRLIGVTVIDVIHIGEPSYLLAHLASKDPETADHSVWMLVQELYTVICQQRAQERGGLVPLLVYLDQIEDQE